MDFNMTIAGYIGAVIVGITSVVDFRSRISVEVRRVAVFFMLATFCILNLSLYIGLLQFTTGITYDFSNYRFVSDTPGEKNLAIVPIAVAFIYFWAGSGTVRVFNKDISFYEYSVALFQKMFPSPAGGASKIMQRINDLSKEVVDLETLIESIHVEAKNHSWRVRQSDWKATKRYSEAASRPIDVLEEIAHTAAKDRTTKQQRLHIRDVAEKTIEDIQASRRQELREYINSIISDNAENPAFISFMNDKLKIEVSGSSKLSSWQRIFRNVARSLSISFVATFLLTFVFSVAPSDTMQTPEARYALLLLPVVAMCAVFSFIPASDNTVYGVFGSVFLAVFGIFLAALVYYVLVGGPDYVRDEPSGFMAAYGGWGVVVESAVGSLFVAARLGIPVGLALRAVNLELFEKRLKKLVERGYAETVMVFLLIGFLGGFGVMLSGLMFMESSSWGEVVVRSVIRFLMGFVVTTTAAFVSGQIEER